MTVERCFSRRVTLIGGGAGVPALRVAGDCAWAALFGAATGGGGAGLNGATST